ncbi:MAG TPA: hypothetical protein P5149_14375 [Candidatus Competibacteraceae bacterium]|nr:hypothetical protein [Candidatus Competibacteraceae bacterium]
MATNKPYESCTEAALRVGFTRTWVKRLANRGDIPGAYRIGRAWAIPSTWEPVRQRQAKRTA